MAEIRLVREDELEQLLRLYVHLHGEAEASLSGARPVWERILADQDHFVTGAFEGEKLVSSCVLVVVPNLTHGLRPYGLIENVVTHQAYRGRGLASAVLAFAREKAVGRGCYKLMLMTGSKQRETLDFYRRAGYRSEDKTAFVQWLST